MPRRCGIFLVGLTIGLWGCVDGRLVTHAPIEHRLEDLYGTQMTVERPPDPPRHLRWESARIDLALAVGRYIEEHPRLPAPIVEALRHLALVPGLTKEQVQLLWGDPKRVQTLTRTRRQPFDEYWYYAPRQPTGVQWHYRLAFQDGVLEQLRRATFAAYSTTP